WHRDGNTRAEWGKTWTPLSTDESAGEVERLRAEHVELLSLLRDVTSGAGWRVAFDAKTGSIPDAAPLDPDRAQFLRSALAGSGTGDRTAGHADWDGAEENPLEGDTKRAAGKESLEKPLGRGQTGPDASRVAEPRPGADTATPASAPSLPRPFPAAIRYALGPEPAAQRDQTDAARPPAEEGSRCPGCPWPVGTAWPAAAGVGQRNAWIGAPTPGGGRR
ncbi:MAG: hypothetical protein ACRD0H_00940, partial [Actinomycetes bacterium]